MKVKLTNGLEIECTPEEYEILCNKGLIPGVESDKKTTITIDENDPWDVIIKKQPITGPYVPSKDPFRDNTVMMYGCQIPNDSIRYLDNTPTAGTQVDSLTPEQFKRLNIIVGNNTDEQKS